MASDFSPITCASRKEEEKKKKGKQKIDRYGSKEKKQIGTIGRFLLPIPNQLREREKKGKRRKKEAGTGLSVGNAGGKKGKYDSIHYAVVIFSRTRRKERREKN